ncbi:MAG: outer membrane beta-barrel protein [bacterium]|nr:outer membrane beta-barrel protein [bacterium]MDT8396888.1 hypothetical protein [bacterium]
MRRFMVLLAIVLVLVSVTAHAGPSISAGVQTVSFGGDLGKWYDIPSGPGININLMFPEILGVALDFNAGQRKVDDDNGNEVIYTWLEGGPRILFGKDGSKIRPDLFFGVGSYDLEIGPLEWDTATGGYIGFGFQEYATDDWFGRLQIKSAYWKSDTSNTDGATLNIALMMGYEF